MPYPEQINLPFNFASIKHAFSMHNDSSHQPAEPGFWSIIRGNSVVMIHEGNTYRLPEGELPPWLRPRREPLCIGLWQGRPLRAFTIGSDMPLEPPYVAEAFNTSGDSLDSATLTISGLARQILHWDRQSRHCARCGDATEPLSGSWGKKCSGCGAEHFPHIHPCAIVLVKRDNKLLLTRKAEWVAGRYGLVAGFLDFGESLEECAIREVREETGISIENVRYVGSQNWPFPAQLMAGFVADYAGGEIVVDRHELEDARWFPCDDLPPLPPPRSIARYIIDTFGRCS